MRFQAPDGGKSARNLCFSASRRQLEHNGHVPARSDHRYGVLQTPANPRMFKNQSRVNKLNRFQVNMLFRQIRAAEIEAIQTRIAPTNCLKIRRVQVNSNNSSGLAAIDVVKPVSPC